MWYACSTRRKKNIPAMSMPIFMHESIGLVYYQADHAFIFNRFWGSDELKYGVHRWCIPFYVMALDSRTRRYQKVRTCDDLNKIYNKYFFNEYCAHIVLKRRTNLFMIHIYIWRGIKKWLVHGRKYVSQLNFTNKIKKFFLACENKL